MTRKPKKVEPKNISASSIDPKRGVASAPDGLYDPANPGHRWDLPLQAPGRMQVDFEERVDFRRLHNYRLARTRNALAKSGLGALLVFAADSHAWRAVGTSMVFPGVGFLYVASPILFAVTLLLLVVALVMWWGASAHLAIPVVWLASAVVVS